MNLFGFNLSRARTKSRKSAYQGAIVNRLTNDWPTSILSADAAIQWELKQLRARSRDLERNGGIAERYLSVVEANVIGSQGIKLHMKVPKSDARTTAGVSAGIDTAASLAIEAEWCEFCKRGNFDVTGQHSFQNFARIALRSVARDGDALILVYRGANVPNRWKIAFQLLEGDYIDDLYNIRRGGDGYQRIPTGNTVRMGIELDAFKQKVAVWMFARHPGDYGVDGVYNYDGRRLRIPILGTEPGAPVHAIHLTRTKRPEETRGVPWITPAMITIKMLEGYEEAELVASRAQACKHVFFESDQFSPDGTPLDYPEDSNGQLVEDMEPGAASELPRGVKANFYNPTHPNQAFQDFTKSMKRKISAAVNCGYNSLFVDLESVNYSSIRAGMLDERDHAMVAQSWFRDDFVQPAFEPWLSNALSFGILPFGQTNFDRLNSPQWNFRRWDWVDPAKDVRASVEAIAAKITTRTQVIVDRNGADFEDVIDEYAREQEYMIAHGVDPAPVAQTTEQIIDPNSEDNTDPNAPNTTPAPAAPPQQPHTRAFRIKRADGTEIKGEISDLREITGKSCFQPDSADAASSPSSAEPAGKMPTVQDRQGCLSSDG